jgi:phospholipid/cholesterol/gamma-HCH transport system substrate-binding protein
LSTIFDVRNIRLPRMSKATVIIAIVAVALVAVLGYFGFKAYKALTTNTVVAYFSEANALYAGDKVQIMGMKVGRIEKIEPAGDKMKVTFNYENKYKVPANASAMILNPTLVASRAIQLEPVYRGGPVLRDNAVIPRTSSTSSDPLRRSRRVRSVR